MAFVVPLLKVMISKAEVKKQSRREQTVLSAWNPTKMAISFAFQTIPSALTLSTATVWMIGCNDMMSVLVAEGHICMSQLSLNGFCPDR